MAMPSQLVVLERILVVVTDVVRDGDDDLALYKWCSRVCSLMHESLFFNLVLIVDARVHLANVKGERERDLGLKMDMSSNNNIAK
jgi:hypothetical protein